MTNHIKLANSQKPEIVFRLLLPARFLARGMFLDFKPEGCLAFFGQHFLKKKLVLDFQKACLVISELKPVS